MEILNNAWVVGIGGGILSSLLVAIITRNIFSKRDNKEYFQNVRSANTEVLYAIRPGISEGLIPNKEVVEHLIEATARKYSIEMDSMLDLSKIASELIKEVMDSSFISAQTKQDFCGKLSTLKPVVRTHEITESNKASYSKDKYRSQMVGMMATMAGLTTAIAAFYTSINSDSIGPPERLTILLVPAAAAIAVAILSVLTKELAKAKLTSFKVDLMGVKADFIPKSSDERKNP